VSNYSAKDTVLAQIAVAVTCLVLGSGLIGLFAVGASSLSAHLYAGARKDFTIEAALSGLGLVLLLIVMISWQFLEAVPVSRIFRLSVKVAFWGGVGYSVLALCFFLLTGTDFKYILLEIPFFLVLSILLGFVVGRTQAAYLRIQGFDSAEFARQVSSEADAQAAHLRTLSYRHRVRTIWGIIFSAFLVALLIGFMWFMAIAGSSEASLGLLLLIGLIALFAFGIARSLEFLSNPDIKSVEGQISKSMDNRSEASLYILNCEGQEFLTDHQTWGGIVEGLNYHLWYSPVNRTAIAFELAKVQPHNLRLSTALPSQPSKRPAVKWLLGLGAALLAILWWRKRD
jgi:hypothetical protein